MMNATRNKTIVILRHYGPCLMTAIVIYYTTRRMTIQIQQKICFECEKNYDQCFYLFALYTNACDFWSPFFFPPPEKKNGSFRRTTSFLSMIQGREEFPSLFTRRGEDFEYKISIVWVWKMTNSCNKFHFSRFLIRFIC